MAENKEDIRPIEEIISQLVERVRGVEYVGPRTQFVLDYSGIYTFADYLLPEELSKYGKGMTVNPIRNNMLALTIPPCPENEVIVETLRAEWAQKKFIPALARQIDNVESYPNETHFVLDDEGVMGAGNAIFLAEQLSHTMPYGKEGEHSDFAYSVYKNALIIKNNPKTKQLVIDLKKAWVDEEMGMLDNVKKYLLRHSPGENSDTLEKLSKAFYNRVYGKSLLSEVSAGYPENMDKKIFGAGEPKLNRQTIGRFIYVAKQIYRTTDNPMLYNAVLFGEVKAALDKAVGKEPFSLKAYAEQRSRNVGGERGGR